MRWSATARRPGRPPRGDPHLPCWRRHPVGCRRPRRWDGRGEEGGEWECAAVAGQWRGDKERSGWDAIRARAPAGGMTAPVRRGQPSTTTSHSRPSTRTPPRTPPFPFPPAAVPSTDSALHARHGCRCRCAGGARCPDGHDGTFAHEGMPARVQWRLVVVVAAVAVAVVGVGARGGCRGRQQPRGPRRVAGADARWLAVGVWGVVA